MINMMVGEYNFDENFTFEKGNEEEFKILFSKELLRADICCKVLFNKLLSRKVEADSKVVKTLNRVYATLMMVSV